MGDSFINVIISSFAALLAVAISHLISEYRKFKSNLNGLLYEMETNLITISDIEDKLRLDLEHNLSVTYRTDRGIEDAKFAITLKRLDTTSYDLFKNNGYFVKIYPKLRRQIEKIYWDFTSINRLIDFYHYLKENKNERWDSETIKNHELILFYIDGIKELNTKEFQDQLKGIRFKI
jgi:hypothetical protein